MWEFSVVEAAVVTDVVTGAGDSEDVGIVVEVRVVDSVLTTVVVGISVVEDAVVTDVVTGAVVSEVLGIVVEVEFRILKLQLWMLLALLLKVWLMKL